MRKILMGLAMLVIFYNGAYAGLFKDDVDLADLSRLSPEALETLKQTEFNVFLMKVKLAGAKVLEDMAKNDLKTSKLTLDAKKQRFKSAEADLKEAKASQNPTLIDSAEKALRNSDKEIGNAKLLIQWKEKEVDVQAVGVEKAKLAVALSEAERDLARVSKLIEKNMPSAKKYNLSDFKEMLDKKHTKYQKVLSTEKKVILEAKGLKAKYDSQ